MSATNCGEGASRSSQTKTNNYDIGITSKLRILRVYTLE